jgi:tRNA (mo5U34)-methyltransferase
MSNNQSGEFAAAAEAAAANVNSAADALATWPAATWFHSFTLADGTRVDSPCKSVELLQMEFDAFFAGIDFRDCSVLDIGAWDGAFSFEAKRRGAARVLATDWWAWTHSGSRALERFLYVRRNLGLDVDYRLIDIPELSVSTVGSFDVVLFLGVFYHLREPLSIIDRLAGIAKSLLIVESHLDLVELPFPAMRFYPGAEINNDPTNWWGPNPACIEQLLKTAGFAEVGFWPHPTGGRGIFHAWPSNRTGRGLIGASAT